MTLTPANQVHFLLVDDREQNLFALETLLRRDDLTLLKARSGIEALELLLRHDIALALIDVQMPGMDGFELAELMRGSERTRRVPIIFLTAESSDRQRDFRGYEAGAVDFLQKPIDPVILRSKTSVFLELYRQRQEVAWQRDELASMIEKNERLLEESQQYSAALRDADRRKDEFLAMLAHELRNPLAPIRAGLDLLLLSGVQHESVPLMQEQVDHLVRMVDDLLDVSRIMQGKIHLRKEPVDLVDIARRASESVAPFMRTQRHQLHFSCTAQEIWLNGDPVRIMQIIVNLLNNAIKYTPPGGRIDLEISRLQTTATLKIRDNGMGIAADLLPRIFDPFIQADRSLERSEGGLGIGLTLVKTLVQLHAGTIQAESAGVDQGSEFSVTLPAEAAPAQQGEQTAAPSISTGQRILIVDDNKGTTHIAASLLGKLGIDRVRVAHDGVEALAVAREFRPDVIFMDIGLPKMNGYEVARQIRNDPETSSITLVAVTGYGSPDDMQLALDAGFNLHITKPASLAAYRQALQSTSLPTKE